MMIATNGKVLPKTIIIAHPVCRNDPPELFLTRMSKELSTLMELTKAVTPIGWRKNSMREKSTSGRTINHRLRPQIIDVEASGFGYDSYPIEVGVVLSNGLRFSRMIRPLPDWTHWDASAESLHGISQKELQRHGHNPFEVARELNELLAGQTV